MKIIVIGAQASGMSCVARLKRNKPEYEIKVFEKSDYISFGACGLPYFVGDFFNDESYMFAKTPEDFIKIGVDVRLKQEAVYLDDKNKKLIIRDLENNKEYEEQYDKLLIATGSRARNLPSFLFMKKVKNIVNLKTLEESKILKRKLQQEEIKHLAIIGGGYIGLELLELKKQYKNVKITLIDSKKNLSDNFIDSDFEDILKQELSNHQIEYILESKIVNIVEENNVITIKIQKDDSAKESTIEIKCDYIVSAIGFEPNVDFIKNNSFDKIKNGAIKINNKGETSLSDIYACGDVASVYHSILKEHKYIPLATLANKIGRVIGDNLANKNEKMLDIIGSSSLRLLDLEIAKTGITEFEAKAHNIPYKAVFIKDYNHTNYYFGQSEIFAKIILNEDKSKILGATIVGKDGVALRAHGLSIAIVKEIHPKELGMLDFAYSPTFTRTWEFLNIIGNVCSK